MNTIMIIIIVVVLLLLLLLLGQRAGCLGAWGPGWLEAWVRNNNDNNNNILIMQQIIKTTLISVLLLMILLILIPGCLGCPKHMWARLPGCLAVICAVCPSSACSESQYYYLYYF